MPYAAKFQVRKGIPESNAQRHSGRPLCASKMSDTASKDLNGNRNNRY